MKKARLMFGCLGNGLTVCDRSREEGGDYKHVAHIDPCGAVRLYDRSIQPDDLAQINAHASAMAGEFKEWFLRQRRDYVLDMLNNRLNVGQFLLVFHDDKIAEKSMEDIYQTYIRYVCMNDQRRMPETVSA